MRARALLAGMVVMAALSAAAAPAPALPVIDVHFSVKIIKNPVTGARPPIDDANPSLLLTDAHLQTMFTVANDSLLAVYWRGYRFVLDEIVEVGSVCSGCSSTNPSYWYSVTFADGTTPTMLTMETTAMANPAFVWRANAVNVYVNQGKGDGAVSSFPPPDPRSNHIVIVGSRAFEPDYVPNFAPSIFVHELGHYFSLPHPNGTLVDCCDPNTCITDGDLIADTLPDGPCFTRDQLSQFNYGLPFASLGAANRTNILNIFWNNMSYLHEHDGQSYGQTFMYRLTEGQLDRVADVANDVRAAVRSGRTWFVSPSGNFFGTGASTNALLYPSQGVGAANAAGGDIVLLRPGTYPQNLTITKPVTLRASHAGTAVIGN